MRGAEAEERAAVFLQQQGHRIVQRNYRVVGGEIDIISLDLGITGDIVVFTEVKHRLRAKHGHPAEYITARKAALLRKTALQYLGRDDIACRFDLITILGYVDTGELVWLKNIFD